MGEPVGGPAGSPTVGSAEPVDGFVVVDKPSGLTSHDVVATCRRIFGQRRIGHAGTLDPPATGVLCLGLGRATRLLRFVEGAPKRYAGEIVLGVGTTTLDDTGTPVERVSMGPVSDAELEALIPVFSGRIEQVPPMVSAVKVDGRRLYALAREGVEVARAARRVEIYRLELAPGGEPGVLSLEVECSPGTYVRTLAADIGRHLGGVAHLRNLRRLAVGPFGVERAHPLAVLAEAGRDLVEPPAAAVVGLDRVEIEDALAARVRLGYQPSSLELGLAGDGPWAVFAPDGTLVAVWERAGAGAPRAAVVLAG